MDTKTGKFDRADVTASVRHRHTKVSAGALSPTRVSKKLLLSLRSCPAVLPSKMRSRESVKELQDDSQNQQKKEKRKQVFHFSSESSAWLW